MVCFIRHSLKLYQCVFSVFSLSLMYPLVDTLRVLPPEVTVLKGVLY